MERLFQAQIDTLRNKGLSEKNIGCLLEKKISTLTRCSGIELQSGRIPFVPVIPRTWLSLPTQLSMLPDYGTIRGSCVPTLISFDTVETPQEPYYIFDVEDGESMCGVAPLQAAKLIRAQSRRGLTDVEAIALCLHKDVLAHHYVDAIASQYNEDGKMGVPSVIMKAGRPRLAINWYEFGGHGLWGAASCSAA
jgi:hypothetical protein